EARLAVDVLDLDGRVVDEDPDREREAAEGLDVDRLTERREYDERAQDRERDRRRDDQRAACTADEQQDHQGGEGRRDERLPNDAGDRSAYEYGLIGEGSDLEL